MARELMSRAEQQAFLERRDPPDMTAHLAALRTILTEAEAGARPRDAQMRLSAVLARLRSLYAEATGTALPEPPAPAADDG